MSKAKAPVFNKWHISPEEIIKDLSDLIGSFHKKLNKSQTEKKAYFSIVKKLFEENTKQITVLYTETEGKIEVTYSKETTEEKKRALEEFLLEPVFGFTLITLYEDATLEPPINDNIFYYFVNRKQKAFLKGKSIVSLIKKEAELKTYEADLKAYEKELKQKALELEKEKKELEAERLHKQPRSYLKTTAKYVGKATDEKTLFSLPEIIPESGGNFLREVISKNTAILGNLLLQLWQQTGGEPIVIKNLSYLAEKMGNTNYEIKIYLLYLGGYVYPIIDKDEGGLTLTTEQLFKVKFRYSNKVANKYKDGNYKRIRAGLTEFIKDEPVDSIEITPSPLFIKALEGKGLGNILVVNDTFIKLALSLSDIAYKIFTYSASNKPSQKIAEVNLVKHLGLEKQIKTQGRPRIRATILKGLQELQDKEHIKSYSYEEDTGMYLFTYSEKYVRYNEGKRSKNLSLETPL